MEINCYVAVFAVLCTFPLLGYGSSCQSPTMTSDVYTTTEANIASSSVVVVEVTVNCKGGNKDLNLYAEMNGRVLPASRLADANKYQVSFGDEHKKLPAGLYTVRFFDEEGYSALRKVQRSGDNPASIKHMFTVPVSHPGATYGQWVQSEFVAVTVAAVLWYFAYNARSQLQH